MLNRAQSGYLRHLDHKRCCTFPACPLRADRGAQVHVRKTASDGDGDGEATATATATTTTTTTTTTATAATRAGEPYWQARLDAAARNTAAS